MSEHGGIYFEEHGSGEPVLLLHGFSGSGEDWKSSTDGWGSGFRLIMPDLRGHGRSGVLTKPFRHDDAANDVLALLDCLEIPQCMGIRVSGGGNVLLHVAAKQPERVKAMVLVSATPYFPEQARAIMRQYGENLPEAQWEYLRGRHPGGDKQIHAILASTKAFAESYDDLNFTPASLAMIQARTLIVQGDRDPLYPVELSIEMLRGIPNSSLWVVPGAGHGPVLDERWSDFQRAAAAFLRAQ